MTLHSGTSFGEALKTWRTRRHLSQLDLALDANVSARHISFLETGRARPSREMVLQLARTLDLPLRARNELLEQAGFRRAFAETGLDASALAPIRAALDHMLRSHMPYPALICDRYWTLIDANPAAHSLLSPLLGGGSERNIARMLASNPAAREVIENWDEVIGDFASRLKLEAGRSGGDPILNALLQLVGSAAPARSDENSSAQPFISVRLRLGATRLSMLSMLAEFGTPRDITISDLRIELFYPADQATEAFFRQTCNRTTAAP